MLWILEILEMSGLDLVNRSILVLFRVAMGIYSVILWIYSEFQGSSFIFAVYRYFSAYFCFQLEHFKSQSDS